MNVSKRIKLAKRHKTFTNCFGTALYIAGIINQDRFISYIWDYELRLERLIRLEQPELYSLAIFRKDESDIDHMAIVTGINPVLVTHRALDGYQFVENVPLEEAVKTYRPSIIEYRRVLNVH